MQNPEESEKKYSFNGGHVDIIFNAIPWYLEIKDAEESTPSPEVLAMLLGQSLPDETRIQALFTIDAAQSYQLGTATEEQLDAALQLLDHQENRQPWVVVLQTAIFKAIINEQRNGLSAALVESLKFYETMPKRYLPIVETVIMYWETVLNFMEYMCAPTTLEKINNLLDRLEAGEIVDPKTEEYAQLYKWVALIFEGGLRNFTEWQPLLRESAQYVESTVLNPEYRELAMWGADITPELLETVTTAVQQIKEFPFEQLIEQARPTLERLTPFAAAEEERLLELSKRVA